MGQAIGQGGFFGTIPAPAPPSGAPWVLRASGTVNTLFGAAYGGGTYVAVGDLSTILTSPDAIHWTTRANPFNAALALSDVAYGNGRFVAVGKEFGYSPDGIAWTLTTPATAPQCATVATDGAGTWIAVSNLNPLGVGQFAIYKSTDNGATWTGSTPAYYPSSFIFQRVEYDAVGGRFLVTLVDQTGLASPQVGAAADGITYTRYNLSTYNLGSQIVYGVLPNATDSLFVTCGDPNADNIPHIETSPAIPWVGTARPNVIDADGNSFSSLAFGHNHFIASTFIGHKSYSSPDGITWTREDNQFGSNIVYDTIFGNALFVAVGDHGTIATRMQL